MLTPLSIAAPEACQRVSPVSAFEVVDSAHAIVRAIAFEYSLAPEGPSRTTGEPESRVKFEIKEILRGPSDLRVLELNGYLSDKDDFNDHRPPYTFVRPGGRAGSCYANTYKQGAQFLLFLKKGAVGYTVNWNALAPVNEQLHSEDDPWLFWVRGYLAGKHGKLR
jgi:hypothetical protein